MNDRSSWSAVIRGPLMRGIIQTRKIGCAYGVSFRKRWTPDLELHGEDFKEEHKQVIAYSHWAVTNRNIERGIRSSMQWYVRKASNIILRLRSYSNQKSGRRVYRADRDLPLLPYSWHPAQFELQRCPLHARMASRERGTGLPRSG
jgi:hypothetical protein